jgi:hypothetical protein
MCRALVRNQVSSHRKTSFQLSRTDVPVHPDSLDPITSLPAPVVRRMSMADNRKR